MQWRDRDVCLLVDAQRLYCGCQSLFKKTFESLSAIPNLHDAITEIRVACSRSRSRDEGRFISRLRVETAVRQLEESDKSLEEIAWSCGFGSADTMNRAFRRETGRLASGFASKEAMSQARCRRIAATREQRSRAEGERKLAARPSGSPVTTRYFSGIQLEAPLTSHIQRGYESHRSSLRRRSVETS
jgi:AraC-like DNA-binding protein